VKLKNEAKPIAPQGRPGGIRSGVNPLTAQINLTSIRSVEKPQQVEQRAFATATRADDRIDLAGFQVEGNPAQHVVPLSAFAQITVQVTHLQNRFIGRRHTHPDVPRITTPGST